MKKLDYVFLVHRLSCKDDGSWVGPVQVRQSNECKNSERVLAGNIAAHYLKPGETGVKVEFLGLQDHRDPKSEITPMGNFTLTLIREGFGIESELRRCLRELVNRCDGDEGVRADGSNIDTTQAHAALGDLTKEKP